MSIVIAGAGAFGTALAIRMAEGADVTLWTRSPEQAAQMAATRCSPRLPDAPLPKAVRVTADPAELAAGEVVLLAVPMQATGGLLAEHSDRLDGRALVACAKGVDLRTLQGPAALIAAACPAAIPAILTGPSFAAEIARGLPTGLTLACADPGVGQALQELLARPTLRLYRTTDVTGAELGGALKNVVAIAAGIVIGAGLGESARAALMTRGYAEMTRMALQLGAEAGTLAGMSGFGDLVLTCTSSLSRNYRHGLALGSGTRPAAGVTVEGVATARAVAALAERLQVDLPVIATVAAVTTGALSVPDAVAMLLSRPLKEE
jgi:glycerol-3-phosphate dehydrogenase (NAD(P)+)